MNDARKALIGELVADLTPVASPGRTGRATGLWLVGAFVWGIAILLATGPLRPGAIGHLIDYPSFAVETVVALATILAFTFATFALVIPGRGRPGRLIAIPAVLFGAWAAIYLIGLEWPAHPVSTLGQRDHCVLEGVLFGLPNVVAMLVVARRYHPVWPRLTAAAAALAGAAIPAELMQFGCMYVPKHILLEHLGPAVLTALVAAALGPLILKPRMPQLARHRGRPH